MTDGHQRRNVTTSSSLLQLATLIASLIRARLPYRALTLSLTCPVVQSRRMIYFEPHRSDLKMEGLQNRKPIDRSFSKKKTSLTNGALRIDRLVCLDVETGRSM